MGTMGLPGVACPLTTGGHQDGGDRVATPTCRQAAGRGCAIFRVITLVVLACSASSVQGQLDFESAPINYHTAAVEDRVQRLQDQLDAGAADLEYDESHGYLRSVLQQLNVPLSSQVLVFSKTSFQLRKITARRPRAVYFNDDVYVGWVQRGDVVEVSAADPNQGAVFYTLDQSSSESPRFVRDRGQCISCHASSRTAGVPGHLVRSVYCDQSGQPFFGSGTFTSDHRSPFRERWGGWYVSGTHGTHRHMGNVVTDRDQPESLDMEAGANATDLSQFVDVGPYLTRHSDIVALMVLEHQTQMHNLITRANFETRSALHYNQIMNEAMERPDDYLSDSTQRRIDTVCEKLVEYLLFEDEFQLQDPIVGTSGFADEFVARGPFDSRGRSLRQLDLKSRLMRFPCSYLIYSEPFDHLPELAKEQVYRRLWDVLSDPEPDDRMAHLSQADRQAIREILSETKSDLPDYWRS